MLLDTPDRSLHHQQPSNHLSLRFTFRGNLSAHNLFLLLYEIHHTSRYGSGT